MNQLATVTLQENPKSADRQQSNYELCSGTLGNASSTSAFIAGPMEFTYDNISNSAGGFIGFKVPQYRERTFSPTIRQSAGRLTGPVQVLKRIFATWDLSRQEIAAILAYFDPILAENVLAGVTTLRGLDREDRTRLVYQIYRVLSSLFPDQENQRKWLRLPNPLLNGRSPLSVIIQDRIPGMILVRDLVDRLAGR